MDVVPDSLASSGTVSTKRCSTENSRCVAPERGVVSDADRPGSWSVTPPPRPLGASRAPRSLGLQLIESPTQDALSTDEQLVACEVCCMDDDEFVTSVDETVSMGSTESNMLQQ